MRPAQYSTATLIDLFHRHTVASLPEVMAALGTRARRTAFRKLKELPYRTSYSHRGGYYTLEELIDFDQHGLWSFRAVRFSAAGTLLATTAAMVSDAPAGQFSEELDNLLHVGTQDALRKLVQQRKLTRQKVAGQFLYCAADRTRKAQQLSARRALLAAPGLVGPVPDADLMPDQLRAAIVLFASLLDERQRRLYAGLESLKCGWGGDARIAGLLGIDPGTVARGRKQLLAQDIERVRVRRPGGGRPPLEKNSRGDRRHRSGLAARCRRRSHHRYPLDPPHHREDRNRTRHPRHPGLSQDRRPHPQRSRLPAARQPQARLGRIRPRPRPGQPRRPRRFAAPRGARNPDSSGRPVAVAAVRRRLPRRR